MPGPLFLGFDVGTQSVKAVCIDADRQQVVARAAAPLSLLSGLPVGHMEQHPDDWLAAIRTVARRIGDQVDGRRIAGLAVSGQQHGAVVLDERGAVVRPAKLWCDTATADEAAELTRRLGRPMPTGFTASKLLWLAHHEPDRWARVRRVLLPHDYVNLWCTGEATMECGDASGTGWFDPVQRRFDVAAMVAIDARLPELLPPLVPAGSVVGRLRADVAAQLGLSNGIPVATGGGDNMMSAIGAGATRSGVAVVSLGTSGTIFARSDAPTVDPEGLVAPFCSSDGAFLPLLCVMNVTGVTEEVKELTGMDHAALTAVARAVPPGCGGLTWLPFLLGERVPDLPRATGTLLGMRPGHLRPGHLYRAALEGTTLNLGLGARRLVRLGVPIRDVRVTGGGAHNTLWCELLAAVLDAPVRVLAETESAALGAALQALWTVRRAGGERDLGCDEVAGPFVQCSEPTVASAAAVDSYATLAEHFAAAITRHAGAGES